MKNELRINVDFDGVHGGITNFVICSVDQNFVKDLV